MRHLGGKTAPLLPKLPGASGSAQPLSSQAAGRACCGRHVEDPNPTYSWHRDLLQRRACQGCPDTDRKSAPDLGVHRREHSSWKAGEIISGGSLDVKNMVSTTTGGGRAGGPHPPGVRHPLISLSLFLHSGKLPRF